MCISIPSRPARRRRRRLILTRRRTRRKSSAYGSYWIPIDGSILSLDLGKWASSLGIEGNYTKDQMNYSRSFWFNFLPFYHAGLRANLKLDDQVSFNYWVVNGADQTEAFNNYKDQMFGFVVTPVPAVSWTFEGAPPAALSMLDTK